MRKVLKYELDISDEVQKVDCWLGRVCLVGTQGDRLFIWIEVDTREPAVVRRFLVEGTGHALIEGSVWVGSCQMPPFVWHIYESEQP